jgi:sphingomyelin phosphodiesterase acid-like 3
VNPRRLVVVWLIWVWATVPGAVWGQSGRFLLISDIHFDPFADAGLFPRLVVAEVDEWPAILEQGGALRLNPIGADSNYALLKTSLDDARQRLPGPDFILYPGDFMAHGWQNKYDRLAARTRADDPTAYRAFTAKAVRFVGEQFRGRWPGTPILPTLGNDDSYCGDYMIEPEGPFLRMFAELWFPLLGPTADPPEFARTFAAGGHYSLLLPAAGRRRLIVLNSVFFSAAYDNACGQPTQTPALDQLAWLAEELARAEAANERVWLLMHIPPGINAYAAARDETRHDPPESFWQQAITARFLQLVDRHRDTIQTSFVGHTHMDDFRVIQLRGQPLLLIKIAPAISPIFGNNPGYQVYQYDPASGQLRNYQTYYLTNPGTREKPTLLRDARWKQEYDFHDAYQLPEVSAATIARLARGIQTDSAVSALYTRFYTVGAQPAFGPKTIEAFSCAILNVTAAEYQACYGQAAGAIRREFPGLQPSR